MNDPERDRLWVLLVVQRCDPDRSKFRGPMMERFDPDRGKFRGPMVERCDHEPRPPRDAEDQLGARTCEGEAGRQADVRVRNEEHECE